jgi:mannan endo-1,4-beta-mannosidase
MVPILVDAATTCKTDRQVFDDTIGVWEANAPLLRELGQRAILDISSEWGTFDGRLWADAHIDGIRRIRATGYTGIIMMSSGGACGQNPRTVQEFGLEVQASDPLNNVLFDIHMYGYWRTAEATDVGRWNDFGSASPWRITTELQRIKDLGLAVIVGEIAWQGSPQVRYQTQAALDDLRSLGVSWVAWSWNQNSDSELDLVQFARPPAITYSEADLAEGGRVFVAEMRK